MGVRLGFSWPKMALALVAVSVLVAVAYVVVLPIIISRQYVDRVEAAASALNKNFQAISESTELPLLTDSGATQPVKNDNAATIKRLVDTGQQQIDNFISLSNDFAPPPYSDVLGQYRRANMVKQRAGFVASQSSAALKGYLDLVNYIVIFDETTQAAMRELDSFNTVVDLNVYAGKSDEVAQVAARLRSAAGRLAAAVPPVAVSDLNSAAISALSQAADGFDDLARGLDIPADAPIYAAASVIEAASKKLSEITGPSYDGALEGSREIKNIQDLSEKIELVTSI